MITLPFSTLTLIILILIAGPILCCLTVILTHRVDSKLERKHLNARRAAVVNREMDVANRVESVEGREWVAAERENMLAERRLELSRQAHDLDDLVRGQMILMDDHDTTIMDIWQGVQNGPE